MPLLKDQLISCLADWMAYDSKLSALSEQEEISIECKARLAQSEVETQIVAFLLRQPGFNEINARQTLNKVVVTEALLRWHCTLTLSLFYFDLSALQNSSLHHQQARYYETKSETARDQLFETGLGIVNNPIPKATAPALVITPGNNPQRFLRARVRFVDAHGAVGTVSPEFLLDMTEGEFIHLHFSTLPGGVAGWLLFLGESSDSLFQATPSPIDEETVLNVTPDMPALDAEVLKFDTQSPDRYLRYSTEIWR